MQQVNNNVIHQTESVLKSKVTKHVHKWTIQDFVHKFSMVEQNKSATFLRSGPFPVFIGDISHDFQLCICKHGNDINQIVCIFLKLESPGPVYSTLILSEGSSIAKCQILSKEMDLAEIHIFDKAHEWGLYKLVRDLKLEDGALTVYCNMVIHRRESTAAVQYVAPAMILPAKGRLFIDRKQHEHLSDFNIVCGTQSVKVHRLVLSQNSKVFQAMFEHGQMLENMNHEMEIKDFVPSTVMIMIDFMYSNESAIMPDTKESLEELLRISDKYEFEMLQNACEVKLIEKFLTVESASSLLCTGLILNCKLLTSQAKLLVKANLDNITTSQDYADLMRQFPDALLEKKEIQTKRSAEKTGTRETEGRNKKKRTRK